MRCLTGAIQRKIFKEHSMGEKLEENKNRRAERITNMVFYTEVLRLVKFYLHSFSFDTSAESLRHFVDLQSKKAGHKGNGSSPQEVSTCSGVCTGVCRSERGALVRDSSSVECNDIRDSSMHIRCDDQKCLFLEEVRILILSLIPTVEKRSRESLQRYHLFVHLIELSLDSQKTKHQKASEFLNANFALDADDVVGHACRGNYGALISISPELGPAVEMLSMHRGGMSREELQELQERYSIPKFLMKILTGRFRDFRNSLEEDCYFLLHSLQTHSSSAFLRVFDGDLQALSSQESSFVRLVFLLVYPSTDLRSFERCFEDLFSETFDDDHLVGLDFLAFSRKCRFYFDYLVQSIPLNCITVESLVRFATKNGLRKDPIILKFGYLLQEQGEYDQLCRFVLNNKIQGFKYKKDFLEYFIANFDRFRFFVSDGMAEDRSMRFISAMSSIDFVDEASLRDMFRSEHFLWFVEKIMSSLSARNDLSEKVVLDLMNMLFEHENQSGVSLKDHKSTLAKKLIK